MTFFMCLSGPIGSCSSRRRGYVKVHNSSSSHTQQQPPAAAVKYCKFYRTACKKVAFLAGWSYHFKSFIHLRILSGKLIFLTWLLRAKVLLAFLKSCRFDYFNFHFVYGFLFYYLELEKSVKDALESTDEKQMKMKKLRKIVMKPYKTQFADKASRKSMFLEILNYLEKEGRVKIIDKVVQAIEIRRKRGISDVDVAAATAKVPKSDAFPTTTETALIEGNEENTVTILLFYAYCQPAMTAGKFIWSKLWLSW
jgi:hypothetical protein